MNFPPNPVDGQLYSEAERNFRWLDVPGVWESVSGPSGVSVVNNLEGGYAYSTYINDQDIDGGTA